MYSNVEREKRMRIIRAVLETLMARVRTIRRRELAGIPKNLAWRNIVGRLEWLVVEARMLRLRI